MRNGIQRMSMALRGELHGRPDIAFIKRSSSELAHAAALIVKVVCGLYGFTLYFRLEPRGGARRLVSEKGKTIPHAETKFSLARPNTGGGTPWIANTQVPVCAHAPPATPRKRHSHSGHSLRRRRLSARTGGATCRRSRCRSGRLAGRMPRPTPARTECGVRGAEGFGRGAPQAESAAGAAGSHGCRGVQWVPCGCSMGAAGC